MQNKHTFRLSSGESVRLNIYPDAGVHIRSSIVYFVSYSSHTFPSCYHLMKCKVRTGIGPLLSPYRALHLIAFARRRE
jgi:hypothetical protein